MPVIDGVLVPRTPLTLAELNVDYLGHYDHVTQRRQQVEQTAKRRLRRIVYATAATGQAPLPQIGLLAVTLERALYQTASFGYRQSRREISALRAEPARARLEIRDAGGYSRVATGGLQAIRELLRHRAQLAASTIAAAAAAAAREARLDQEASVVAVQIAVAAQAARSLHNHVLELIGETLNLGRAAGALSFPQPPQFALRSEQLDKATCDACTRLHGSIVEVGSPSFYEYLPPAGCYGGGRCRGIMIFADELEQARGPDIEPTGPQPPLTPIPPVEFPRRRAA